MTWRTKSLVIYLVGAILFAWGTRSLHLGKDWFIASGGVILMMYAWRWKVTKE